MRILLPLLCASFCALAQPSVTIHARDGGVVLENGLVRLEISSTRVGLAERYSAYDGGWRLVLSGGAGSRPEPSLLCDRVAQPLKWTDVGVVERDGETAAVELKGDFGSHAVTKRIRLRRGEPFASIEVSTRVEGVHEFTHILSTYAFVPDGRTLREYGRPDFVWTPQLRPDSADVIADHTFRSPALMLQSGKLFAALIPDVDLIQPWRGVETAGDLVAAGVEAPLMSYGAMNWRPRAHVYYTHSEAMTSLLENSRYSYGYFLFLRADAPQGEGYRDVVRFHWNRWGRKNLLNRTGPQSEPFAAYVRKAWDEYLPQIAVSADYRGYPVTLLTQGRLAWSNRLPQSANTDSWFNVWFNSLRTSYGMMLHGRSTGDSALVRKAEGVLRLALLAPQQGGIAPSIFYIDSAGGHWVNDHAWGGIDSGRNYAMFHNSWTGVWLLRWAEAMPSLKGEVLHFAEGLGGFLQRNQRASGVIPSWYEPSTGSPVETFRDENAETAGASLFLAELFRQTGNRQFLDASERALKYVRTEILPRQKWFDFETFFSCSRKSVGFVDPFTTQYPQNTLSMHQAAEASLALYRATGKTEYAETGRSIMDYLCLYQQVWSPPWLSCRLFGGFGVQNTDGEWSDSRQGYFAVTLLEYYELTGEREYFERGVAALRAMFSLFESPASPRTWENYAHGGKDRPGGVTGIHWGTGSSVTSIHILEPRYGAAHVNVRGSWGCGIDGCSITSVSVEGRKIRFALRDDVSSGRQLRVTFAEPDGGRYEVVANGTSLGEFASSDLKKGISVDL